MQTMSLWGTANYLFEWLNKAVFPFKLQIEFILKVSIVKTIRIVNSFSIPCGQKNKIVSDTVALLLNVINADKTLWQT